MVVGKDAGDGRCSDRPHASCLADQILGCSMCAVNESTDCTRVRQQWLSIGGGEHLDGPSVGGSEKEEEEAHERSVLKQAGASLFGNVPRFSFATAPLEQELHAIMHGCLALFSEKGLEILHSGGDGYIINGRSVRLWLSQSGSDPQNTLHLRSKVNDETARRAARVLVLDGPLRQPLLDYLLQTGVNEHYDARGTENPTAVTGMARNLEFRVPLNASNDRVEAMRQAAAQAEIRHYTSATSRGSIPHAPEPVPSPLFNDAGSLLRQGMSGFPSVATSAAPLYSRTLSRYQFAADAGCPYPAATAVRNM